MATYRKDGGKGSNGKSGSKGKNYSRDEVYDGESTRPKRYEKSDAFFGGKAKVGYSTKPGMPGGAPKSGGERGSSNAAYGMRDRDGGKSRSGGPSQGAGRRTYGAPDRKEDNARSYGDTRQGNDSRSRDGYRQTNDSKPYGNRSRGDVKPHGTPKPYGESRPHNDAKPYNAPRDAGRRPYGAPPRTAAPQRPVPASVQDDRYDDGYTSYDDAPRANPMPYDAAQALPENLLVGRNPIREAIRAGRTIEKLLVVNGELSGSAREIVAKAHERHIVVQKVDKSRLDAIYPKHQGMLAYVSEASYSTIEEILALAKERGEEPFVIALDGITDPHNLGAIVRTAECAGAHGVIITERRSAGLNPAAVKASAGALNYIKVAKVVNLSRALEELKESGLWIIGGAMDGEPVDQVDLSGPIALVVGSEGEGISQLVRKNCDRAVSLPIKGQIDSLNASVAAGILLYAVLRARA